MAALVCELADVGLAQLGYTESAVEEQCDDGRGAVTGACGVAVGGGEQCLGLLAGERGGGRERHHLGLDACIEVGRGCRPRRAGAWY
nr:hypothetical protein [Micromonospora sp. KC207]